MITLHEIDILVHLGEPAIVTPVECRRQAANVGSCFEEFNELSKPHSRCRARRSDPAGIPKRRWAIDLENLFSTGKESCRHFVR